MFLSGDNKYYYTPYFSRLAMNMKEVETEFID